MAKRCIWGAFALVLFMLCASRLVNGQNMFPYGNVKSWSGDVTVEISEKTDEGVVTYKATGKVILTDEMAPNGSHFQWPQPNPSRMTDPKAMQDAYKRWQATISYQKVVNYKDAVSSANYTCSANATQAAAVQLIAAMGMPDFKLNVEIPRLERVRCVGLRDGAKFDTTEDFRPKRSGVEISGPTKTAGPITGVKELMENGQKIKITYSLIPGNAR